MFLARPLPQILVGVALAATAGLGQSVDMLVAPSPNEPRWVRPPERLAERSALTPDGRLAEAESAAAEDLAALRRWNDEGRLPRRNGFARLLPTPRSVDLGDLDSRFDPAFEGGLARSRHGTLTWTTRIDVADSWRLRLRLENVSLPQGALLWVYSDDGETRGPFGVDLRSPDGVLYTPSVAGPRLTLEVELPAGIARSGARFELREVVQLFSPQDTVNPLAALGPRGSECLVDAQCITDGDWAPIDMVQKSVGHLQFGGGFVCSGNLLNDTIGSLTPYLLTANHCISNQTDASSLEVFWDYTTAACDSVNWPALASLPRSNGSTLLATGASSDYTLLRLNGLAGDRVLLGWNADGVSHDQTIYRVSHPWPDNSAQPHPHTYTKYRVDTTVPVCDGTPRSSFVHMKNLTSATFGGSSGSASMNAAAQVIGQLTGACGPDPSDGCNFENTEVDGDFAATFPNLREWLAAFFEDDFESGLLDKWSSVTGSL